MNSKKWIGRILALILSLAVLAGVGFAGFRVGLVQGANLSAEELAAIFSHGRGTQFNDNQPQADKSRSFDHGHGADGHGFDGRGFERGGRGGFSFFSPLFGLLRLAVLGGLLWLGYRFIKNSGWRLVKANAADNPATAEEAPPAQEDEKKDKA